MRWLVVAWLLAGCRFDPLPRTAATGDDAGSGSDGTEDPRLCLGRSLFQHCLAMMPPPTYDVALGDTVTVDTAQDPQCTEVVPLATGEVCVLAAQTITIKGTLIGTGPRPLVLVATDSISVESTGLIDVSSNRGGRDGAGFDDGPCSATSNFGSSDNGGGGGGGGGTFGGAGGNGGTGDNNDGSKGNPGMASTTLIDPAAVRGGCNGGGAGDGMGGGGIGGHAGGAVYLLARNQVTVGGQIWAAGAGGGGGGAKAGGGGGGSGGLIGLEAPIVSIPTGAVIVAQGGGGGGGGADGSGAGGDDGSNVTTPEANGGKADSGGGDNGGDGGAGTDLDTVVGVPGATADAGGGGGGGGLGINWVVGALTRIGEMSPPAIVTQ